MASTYGIGEAKTHLSELVHRAEQGEEIVLSRGRRPVARLLPIAAEESAANRKPGRMRGRITMHDDFDDWPPDIARALGISD